MSAEENKAIFLRFVNELGKGNLDIVDELCSPDFAFHSPNYPDWPTWSGRSEEVSSACTGSVFGRQNEGRGHLRRR
jgi:hypothetical protein